MAISDFNPRAMMVKAIDLMLQSVNEPRQDGKASPKVGAVLIVPYELAGGRNRLIEGFSPDYSRCCDRPLVVGVLLLGIGWWGQDPPPQE